MELGHLRTHNPNMQRPALYIDTLSPDVKRQLVPLVRTQRLKRFPDAIARSETNARDALTRLHLRNILPVDATFKEIVEDENVSIIMPTMASDVLQLYTANDTGYAFLEKLCDYIGHSIETLSFRRDYIPIEYAHLVQRAMPNIRRLKVHWKMPVASDMYEEKADYPNEFATMKASELDAIISACSPLEEFELILVGVCGKVLIDALTKHIGSIQSLRLSIDLLDASLDTLWRAGSDTLRHVHLNCTTSEEGYMALEVLKENSPNCTVMNERLRGSSSTETL